MDPFTIAILASAGLQVLGGAADVQRAESQARIDRLSGELTAATQTVSVMEQYSNIFEKQISDLSTQKAVFANLGIDKAGTLYSEGLREQEKGFLKSKKQQEEDIKQLQFQKGVSQTEAGLKKVGAQSRILGQTAMSLANLGTAYFGGKR